MSGQHARGPRRTRPSKPGHDPQPVKRPNGDDYCRTCGILLVCRHGRESEAFDHETGS